jgi:uncharacterized protein YbaP (TraB family)
MFFLVISCYNSCFITRIEKIFFLLIVIFQPCVLPIVKEPPELNQLKMKRMKINLFSLNNRKAVLALGWVFIALLQALPSAAQSKPGLFYSITGNGLKDTSWLFGTYHLVNNSYLDEVPVVKNAFQRSAAVVVEINADPAEFSAVQSMGMLKDQQLSDLLDAPFRDSLELALKNTLGTGLQAMNQLKPANVMLTLSIVETMKSQSALFRKYTGKPLDGWFAATAKESGKEVKNLETLLQQMELLFNSSTLEEQVLALKAYIRHNAEMKHLGDELVKNWFAHDLEAIQAVYEKTLQVSGEEDKLIKERNNNWMKVLPQWLNEKSLFIAVGALHLGGEPGLVQQLRNLGFTVTPVNPRQSE